MPEQKKTFDVKIEVKELMYDIMNKSYLTGQARFAESGGQNYQASSNMQASEDEENSYQIRASIASAAAGLKSHLGEYLDENKTTTNNRIPTEVDNDGTIVYAFKLPSNFNQASIDSLGRGIHDYIVDLALGDWFTITNKADAPDYIGRAATHLETAKRALYKRSRPQRPTYN